MVKMDPVSFKGSDLFLILKINTLNISSPGKNITNNTSSANILIFEFPNSIK